MLISSASSQLKAEFSTFHFFSLVCVARVCSVTCFCFIIIIIFITFIVKIFFSNMLHKLNQDPKKSLFFLEKYLS